MNLPNFWYRTSLNFDSFRGTNHTVSCFLIFCVKLGLHTTSMTSKKKFGQIFDPQGGFVPQKTLFG